MKVWWCSSITGFLLPRTMVQGYSLLLIYNLSNSQILDCFEDKSMQTFTSRA